MNTKVYVYWVYSEQGLNKPKPSKVQLDCEHLVAFTAENRKKLSCAGFLVLGTRLIKHDSFRNFSRVLLNV